MNIPASVTIEMSMQSGTDHGIVSGLYAEQLCAGNGAQDWIDALFTPQEEMVDAGADWIRQHPLGENG